MSKFPLGVVLLGLAYAAFSAALAISGAAPKRVMLPVEPSSYYAAQAFFVGPLFAGLIALHTRVVMAVIAVRTVEFRDAYLALGNAYAWPMLALFVVPDALVFALWGFGALANAMRYYAPLAIMAVAVLSILRARELFGASRGRTAFAVLAGLVTQALAGGLLLR